MNKKMMKAFQVLGTVVLISQCALSANVLAQTTTANPAKQSPSLSAPMQATLERISADSMRGHLSFLASDLLEGRATPSRGLDLAAEYIAAQFRVIGLEPGVKDSYFQTADWNVLKKDLPRRRGAPAPVADTEPQSPVIVRNVIGVLPGSDPVLKDSYILVTAHYDHVGMKANAEGDKIFNGANDDASGTVSVIELAKAFAGMKVRPKRSIVFMTFFGEESGLVGSRYYGKNPIFPIEKTVAGINIEQVGRTDDSEGPQVASVAVTGFDFSEVGTIIKQAGDKTGIKVWKHAKNSDDYFGRSDNQAIADQGVPAHTISVAYAFPDYHGLGDEAHKIDYDNMAKVNRAVAVAIEQIANSKDAPKWDEKNPKAAKYLEAWKQRNTSK